MNNNLLYIPKKIKVGFVNRNETYTGKLAYIIYYDEKGILKKERSWESWRDKDIEPLEFDNIPIDEFVINKHVGGYKSDWNFRNSYIRVYDPRGFEFEISIENLLYILDHYDFYKGKGIDGKFVYGWDKTKLVLLPIISSEYNKNIEYSEKRSKNLEETKLFPGYTYLSKNMQKLLYIGDFNCYNLYIRYKVEDHKKQRNIFIDLSNNTICFLSKKNIAEIISTEIPDNFSDYVQIFQDSQYSAPIKSLDLVPNNNGSFIRLADKIYIYNYYLRECYIYDNGIKEKSFSPDTFTLEYCKNAQKNSLIVELSNNNKFIFENYFYYFGEWRKYKHEQ